MADLGNLALEMTRHLPIIIDGKLDLASGYLREHMKWYRAMKHNLPLVPRPSDARKTLKQGAELARALGQWLRDLDFEARDRLEFEIAEQRQQSGATGHIQPRRILANVERTVAALETMIIPAAEGIRGGTTGADSSVRDGLLDAIAKAWEMATGCPFEGIKKSHNGRELRFAAAMLKCADPGLSVREIDGAIRKLQLASRKIRAAKKV
jgi:hypothetical protein